MEPKPYLVVKKECMATLCQAIGLEGSGVVSIVGAGGKTSLMFGLAHELSESGQSVLTTTTTKIMLPNKAQSRHLILTGSLPVFTDNAKKFLKKDRHVSAASGLRPATKDKLSGFSAGFIDEIVQAGLFQWIIVEADGADRKPLKVPAKHEPVIPGSSNWVIGVVGLKAIGKPLHPDWVFRHKAYASITGLSQGRPVTLDSVVQAVIHPAGIFKGSPPQAHKILFLNETGNPDLSETGKSLIKKLRKSPLDQPISRVVMGSPLENRAVAKRLDLSPGSNLS